MNKRIIPCLDIKNGRVVKGKKFENIQDVADPVALALKYEQEKADVLFMLDITGEDRKTFLDIVQKVSATIQIPLYIGGGIRTIKDIEQTLEAGADKISITSAAIHHPKLLSDAVEAFGGDKIVLSIDAKKVNNEAWHAFTAGGRKDSGLDVINWAKQGEADGVSEILLNSIDADGVKDGYDIPLNQNVSNAVSIPVIASGGAGEMEHFKEVLTDGNAQAALAASVFHYETIQISALKTYLGNENIDIKEV